MVKFQIIQNRRFWMVMHELGTLVEESRIVFIGFDTEVFPATETRTFRKTERYTANQKTWLQTGLIQYPRQHRGGRGFTVSTRYTQHVFALQDMISQELRT